MSSRYEPKDHIQYLSVSPRTEDILDQRELTIQSYQTTVPFDYKQLDAALGEAWLAPHIPLGVFSRTQSSDAHALNVVLGLQDSISVRAYDYDKHRPLWFSWQNAIVETVGIHYHHDEAGFLRFTTTGGGRRITDDRLHEFNQAFLGIPKEAVSKQYFDLAKLRELCFGRFMERLYMLRFSDPSGEGYRSIDHASFQSRQYIDPKAERLHEIYADPKVKIESFDSDIQVTAPELAQPMQVRFFIRGLSGSLRLRFPKIQYAKQLTTHMAKARTFYRLVDTTVRHILDAEYYTQQPRSLDELDVELGMFPDMVDLAPFRAVLSYDSARSEFLSTLDLTEPLQKWLPPLRALDELLASEVVASKVSPLLESLVQEDPRKPRNYLPHAREIQGCRGWAVP